MFNMILQDTPTVYGMYVTLMFTGSLIYFLIGRYTLYPQYQYVPYLHNP